jgi:hypothetical protein
VDQDLCPVAGRIIVDNGAGTVVPESGESVFTEAMSPEGNQQLVVINPPGDKLLLREVGSEGAQKDSGTLATRAGGPSACSDPHYYSWGHAPEPLHPVVLQREEHPPGMSKSAVLGAMMRVGTNVSAVQDACGVPDGGPAVGDAGMTRESVNMGTDGVCKANDHKSVVGFGDLPSNRTGNMCVWSWIQDGPDKINSSDDWLNKFDHAWTARVTGSCRGRHDVKSTMTHERSHTFGLGDVSESSHANPTMSSASNGSCQISERTLGKGDAIGLNRKY